jgi:hypothetical protein
MNGKGARRSAPEVAPVDPVQKSNRRIAREKGEERGVGRDVVRYVERIKIPGGNDVDIESFFFTLGELIFRIYCNYIFQINKPFKTEK